MTRIAVLGASGMLGQDVVSVLDGEETRGFSRTDVDITNESAVVEALGGFDVVINCAAYTKVDAAESSPEPAFAANSLGSRIVAKAVSETKSKLIHISTDFVFDGTANTPYPENHPTNPVSIYGVSKQQGEIAIMEENPQNSLIVRTSWLYGEHGSNFPKSILSAGLTRETIDVVDDQQGQPTWTLDVAHQIKLLIDAGIPSGIFHATNSGQTTWFDLAQALFRLAGWEEGRINRVSSDDFGRDARRPAFSVLDHTGWHVHGLAPPRPWEEALDDAWNAFLYSIANPEGSS